MNDLNDLRIDLLSVGYFSTSKIGFFVIDISNLIEMIKPKSTTWGRLKKTEKYQIIQSSNKNQNLGTIEVSIELIFQKFPKKNFKVQESLKSKNFFFSNFFLKLQHRV